jgi:hypothetical protein
MCVQKKKVFFFFVCFDEDSDGDEGGDESGNKYRDDDKDSQ